MFAAYSLVLLLGQLTFDDVTASSGLGVGGRKFAGAAFFDLDRDGCVDAVVNTEELDAGTRLLLGRCDAGFRFDDVTVTAAPGFVNDTFERSVVAGDLDNDGFPEVLLNDDMRVRLWRNQRGKSEALFAAQFAFGVQVDGGPTLPGDIINAEGQGFADVNGDGWLDLISESTGIDLYLNPADGGLALERVFDAGFPIIAWSGDYSATVDFDGDGWVDFLIRSDQLGQLWMNDRGHFTASTSFREEANNNDKGAVAVCDFDGDGRFDIFWSDQGQRPNEVWVQPARRAFSPTGGPGGGARGVNGAACGDLDGDGDADLVMTAPMGSEVWLNDGAARFTRVPGSNLPPAWSAVMVDADRDGDVDLFLNADNTARAFRNDSPARDAVFVSVKTASGRDELGASAHLESCSGARLTPEAELSGGQGRGNQTEPVMRFASPSTPFVVAVLHPGGARTRRAFAAAAGTRRELVLTPGPDDLTACPGDSVSPPIELAATCTVPFTYQPMLSGASGAQWWLSGVDGEALPGGVAVNAMTGEVTWRPGITQKKAWPMEVLAETPGGALLHQRLIITVSCDQELRVCGCGASSPGFGLLLLLAVMLRRRSGYFR